MTQELILASMGELVLKGMNRRQFVRTLTRTVRKRLDGLGKWNVASAQSTLYLRPEDDTAKAKMPTAYARIERVFGLAALSRAAVCSKDFDVVLQTAAAYLGDELKSHRTFKVEARRSDKAYPRDSMDIAREAGAYLLKEFPHLKVDVHNPEVLVTIEIREKDAYVHGGKDRGAGGLPVSSSGRAALLLSGGIDSPVAGWMMARRGLALVGVHFESPPYTSPRAAAKVQTLAGQLSHWVGPIPYHAVPYTETQVYLRDNNPDSGYFTVLMRRSMMRIAHLLAEKEQCEALITGESLAQVASQTLPALNCTNTAQPLPVLRPLIGMDKLDIINIARKIDTYETSIQPYDDCCTLFTPDRPKTRPRMDDVLACEAQLPRLAELEEQAASQAVFTLIDEMKGL